MYFRLIKLADDKKDKEDVSAEDSDESVDVEDERDGDSQEEDDVEVEDDREEGQEDEENKLDSGEKKESGPLEEAQENQNSLEDVVMQGNSDILDARNSDSQVDSDFSQQIKEIANRGREVVEDLEEYKFFIDQTIKSLSGRPELADQIEKAQESVDVASQKIFDVTLKMENIDVTKSFENPLMGIPNEEDNSSLSAEPENFTDDRTQEDSSEDTSLNQDNDGSGNSGDFGDMQSPNDLLSMMDEDELAQIMGGGEEMDSPDVEEEIEEDMPPAAKKTKVEPKGNPKKK